jgi:hypothetical protein
MMRRIDPANVLAKVRSYQLEIYKNGMFSNVFPQVTTDTVRLEEEAEKHVEPRAFNYGEINISTLALICLALTANSGWRRRREGNSKLQSICVSAVAGIPSTQPCCLVNWES